MRSLEDRRAGRGALQALVISLLSVFGSSAAARSSMQDAGSETVRTSARATPLGSALLGRVLDAHGQPLAGARVRLRVPRAEPDAGSSPRDPIDEYTAATDDSCAFRLEVPTQTARYVRLEVEADEWHMPLTRLLGDESTDGPVRAGGNDLGELRLAPAGCVSGTVRDREGRPLEGVEVLAGDSPTGSFDDRRAVRTDADGRYRIGRIRTGKRAVLARRAGWTSDLRADLAIDYRETLEDVDLVLAPAPRLAGRVVDETGRPVAELCFSLEPEGGGLRASALTDDEGRFEVELQADRPHRAWIADRGFEASRAPADGAWPPGIEDARIVLRRRPVVRLVVTDAVTGAPLERFATGHERGPDHPERFSDIAYGFELGRLEEHPGGVLDWTIYPGDGFRIGAPGYRTREGRVPPATGAVTTIPVALHRPSRLAEVRPRTLELEPGQVLELELDLRDHGLCELALDLEGAGFTPRLMPLDLGFVPLAAGAEPVRFPCHPEDGRVRGTVRACGDARVELRTHFGLAIRHPTAVLALVPGGRVEQSLGFPAGRLVVRLPDGVELPESGRFTFTIAPRSAAPGAEPTVLRGHYSGGPRGALPGLIVDREERRLGFELVPAGSHTLTLRLEDPRAPWDVIGHDEGGRPIHGREPGFVGEAEVLVPEGGEVEVEVRLP